MKWISTLDNNDLESMKQIIKETKEDDNHVFFQNRKYEISYINAVITLLEDRHISDEMMDLEINN